jgi:hypothetical protein
MKLFVNLSVVRQATTDLLALFLSLTGLSLIELIVQKSVVLAGLNTRIRAMEQQT